VTPGPIGLADAPGALLAVDAGCTIVDAAPAVSRLTGHPVPTLVGASLPAVLQPADAEGRPIVGWPRAARLPQVSGLAPQLVSVGSAGGDRLTLRLTGRYRRGPGGTFEGAVLSLERPDPRLARDRSIEIISTVSHELRSPLTSVKGYTSLLLHRWERLGDEQKRMMLEAINHDADRVTRLVTELLDISRLETGRLVLRRQLVDLAGLAESVVAKVALSYPELDATVHFEPGVPRVAADPDKIEQVLTNLVENACKYASPQGVRIEGTVTGDKVAVTVTDRGEGIPAEDLPRVFTRFFRRSDARPTGSGLGLWISRGLVQAHGGRLTARSQPPDGAEFRFTLPMGDAGLP
jgi:signal transduction histidine kinase